MPMLLQIHMHIRLDAPIIDDEALVVMFFLANRMLLLQSIREADQQAMTLRLYVNLLG